MIARIQNHMKKEDKGFTLIELLVVMIIIGILAAVAIPIFLSQRAKAQDSAARADVSTLGKEMATYYVDNSGNPPAITINANGQYVMAGVTDPIGNASDNVAVGSVTGDSATNWCIPVTNTEGDVSANPGVRYSAQGGLEDGPCPIP